MGAVPRGVLKAYLHVSVRGRYREDVALVKLLIRMDLLVWGLGQVCTGVLSKKQEVFCMTRVF